MKKLLVTEEDVKQAGILFNLLKEGKFEVKGDAFQLIAGAQKWLATHIQALKVAPEEEFPAQEEPQAAVKPKSRGAK
jgi:hypothetical protein